MDWLVNPAILFLVGYFILGLTGKRKHSQRGDILPRYTTKRNKAEIEKESQEIIKRELKRDAPSYETVRSYENSSTGFLNYYLQFTRNDEKLTTTAKSDIVQTLSENDLLRELKLFLFISSFILNGF